jgi:hypothetical protein
MFPLRRAGIKFLSPQPMKTAGDAIFYAQTREIDKPSSRPYNPEKLVGISGSGKNFPCRIEKAQ